AFQFADRLLPYGNPSSVTVPFSLTAELPIGRRLIESKKASFVTPLLRVASKRTRIHPVPIGTVRMSSVRCQALVDAISPESSVAITLVFVPLRYSTITCAESGTVSAAERR